MNNIGIIGIHHQVLCNTLLPLRPLTAVVAVLESATRGNKSTDFFHMLCEEVALEVLEDCQLNWHSMLC